MIPRLLGDESGDVRQAAVTALRTIGTREQADELLQSAKKEEDPEIKLSMLKTAVELGSSKALVELGLIVGEGGIFADDAYDALKGDLDIEFRKDETKRLIDWIKGHESQLVWNDSTKIFTISSGSWRGKAHF
jgi:hypothetical protein